MNKTLALVFLAGILLSGCAVQKQWSPTGGSRSDGVIRMSFEYGAFQAPTVDNRQGQTLAMQRCAAWGYTGAEAFGSSTRTCVSGDRYGCNVFRVTAEFQCTGQPEKSSLARPAS
jgi:hypothetical protein